MSGIWLVILKNKFLLPPCLNRNRNREMELGRRELFLAVGARMPVAEAGTQALPMEDAPHPGT